MDFEGDAFISYAHLDNKRLSEGQKGWVANFQRALETRVAQLVGREAQVWWDPELRGNEDFSDSLVERLHSVASLVSILSPSYVNSRWGLRELSEFCKAAEQSGSLEISDKARLFKVLKTPVPLEQHPPELRPYLGYEFFKVDPETGRVRELSEMFGDDAERDFWMKLDDLAHDMAGLLSLLHPGPRGSLPEPAGAIYLAETTSDLKAERDAVKRALQQHGYTVLPARTLPIDASEVAAMVHEDLASCRMSIHLFGKTYGLVPEGVAQSLPEMQNDLAALRATMGPFARLLWIPKDLSASDERQRQVLQDVRMDQRFHEGTDLLEGTLEELQTMIASRLATAPKASRASAPASSAKPGAGLVYLIYDPRDAAAATAWSDVLFNDFEVVHPIVDGDEKDIREFHEESLRTCDGVLVLYGSANEAWLRRKLTDIQKSPGYGRTQALPDVGICLIAPDTPAKASFKTHYATVIPQFGGCVPTSLAPFVAAVKARVGGSST